MHIIGTAGHVDHGKSSLVRALTGTDPDRWIEEQRRGMTLDLGFAHLTFPDGAEAGIVDVPGHQRFLHNMLAGAAGMELVLLVIAANEGPKAQTLEHLAILQYLNTRRVVVVLTKADLIDAGALAGTQAELREILQGTLAQDAPIYPVSTVSGAGLDALRAALHDALAALPARAPNAPAYLPIDRVFALAGHGTIVTGTLMQGRIAPGQMLRLTPLDRMVRVRSLHVFGAKRQAAAGGTRVAVNVPGLETSEIARGAVLASPQFEPAASFRVSFTPLVTSLDVMRRRMPVRAYIGAAEILGTLVFERVPERAGATEAKLQLRSSTIAIPGAPFVVRRVSPMSFLGGGTISAASAADGNADAVEENERSAVLTALQATRFFGTTPAAIGAAVNLDAERVKLRLSELLADGRAMALTKPTAAIAADVAGDLLARAAERLEKQQRDKPWLLGLTAQTLAQALAIGEPALIRVLATYVESGALAYRGGYYATVDFSPQLAAEQRAFFDAAFIEIPGSPSEPVAFEALRARIRSSTVPELSAAFETLVAGGTLSKVGEFVYRGSHIARIRAQLEAALHRQGRLTVAEFRTLTGTTRKYAVPLLEFFDATGVTLRSGDVRVLRRTRTPQRA